ncbi:HAD family phosphatase [Enterococcus saccharolyticus]|uniref:Cof-type HAD-IIB family hydrolase n=1 Tax=Enterococcus saccharolyticus TaxID=41997 RepID=UPI001E35DB9A|nr:Cof-type HAD-IIB family hydrolase [Enterococcus saccharolyticus]MCD5002199.1 HAD family phosphatase [Enterococcus saccharolyticus]
MIKLIAIDLDGTLLDRQKQISERNKQALKQAKAQGVKVVICTGRPLRAIEPILEELDLLDEGDYSITFNGGLVQKNDTGEVMERAGLQLADVHRLVDLAKMLDLPLDVLSQEHVIIFNTSENHQTIYPELSPLLLPELAHTADLSEGRLYNKAVVAYHQEYLDQQIQKIPDVFKETYEVIKTRENLLEFMPKGITKAYGISLLAQDLDILPEEVMCIGDEENDLPMIEYAGIGVAMANAIDCVKAIADVVTDSNEADGVAKAVEKYVLQ